MSITRGEDCLPQALELFGVLMYYDEYGISREAFFSLLNATALDWGTQTAQTPQATLTIPLASLKTSYHAFMLRAHSRRGERA